MLDITFCENAANNPSVMTLAQRVKSLFEEQKAGEQITLNFFESEEECLIAASKIAQKLNCPQIKYLFIVKNFINNNFPIIIKKEHTQEEKRLIKFLLFRGDKLDYSKKYKISQDKVNKLIESISNNYDCEDINKAMVLILIEKYLRKENFKFLETLLEIHSINNKTGLFKTIIDTKGDEELKNYKKLWIQIVSNLSYKM